MDAGTRRGDANKKIMSFRRRPESMFIRVGKLDTGLHRHDESEKDVDPVFQRGDGKTRDDEHRTH